MIRAWGDWLERHRKLCYALAALLPVAARIVMLPWIPFPPPRLHDEFGHLLVADTLLHGRLANPAHPMGDLLETVYVLQKTSYASKYPIGQGLSLTPGVAAGTPWLGVLAAGALMGAGMLYALTAMLPVPWALVGAVAGGLRFGAFSYWMDSYWGGCFCAFGASLLLGGMLRWFAAPGAAAARVATAGWGIVFLVRPYESLGIGAVMVAGVLARRAGFLRRFVLPALPVAGLFGAVTLLHNHSATGHWFRTPYQQAQIEYGVPQSLLFQTALEPPAGLTPEQRSVAYWQAATRKKLEAPGAFRYSVKEKSEKYWRFYWGWGLTPLALAALLFVRDWRLWFVLAVTLAPLAQVWSYPFYFEHYAAAAAPAALLLGFAGAARISGLSGWKGIAGLVTAGALIAGGAIGPWRVYVRERIPAPRTSVDERPRVLAELRATRGKDLVLVRRHARQNATHTWVWNEADVDGSEVVWAWEPEDAAARERLLRYFAGRRVWVLRLDSGHPELREQ